MIQSTNQLINTAKALVSPGKGILAADESSGTMEKRLSAIGLQSTEKTRREYRQMLFTTEDIEEFISGVILFDETIRQSTDEGVSFPKLLQDRGIILGIKVDQGKTETPDCPTEAVTKGLDGLRERLEEYKNLGARFTKWRAVFSISGNTPSDICLDLNAEGLAQFAKISQEVDLVPIVEPEVLTDGRHGLAESERVTYKVLKRVFIKLSEHKVEFSGMLLKPNWVHHGKDCPQKASIKEVAEATLRVMKQVVPDEVPGLVFLSGGASPEESTAILVAMNQHDKLPWQLSFSFGRALQSEALKAWGGKPENIKKAQETFYNRAKLVSMARAR
ncbi:fructose-bisphosphate aldolase class I [Patescibacteria group bacterium]|nr:fructose-bisphosphate aldolase class I [Patescibacteria group bacterium]